MKHTPKWQVRSKAVDRVTNLVLFESLWTPKISWIRDQVSLVTFAEGVYRRQARSERAVVESNLVDVRTGPTSRILMAGRAPGRRLSKAELTPECDRVAHVSRHS